MKVRFVGTKKQDSATVRRRLLQAIRTRNYRNRQKTRNYITKANHRGELLPAAVGSVAENGLSELENNSLRDTEEIEENGNFACDNFTISSQEVDDPSISTIEPDPCYGEEVVDIYSTEEGGDR
jgi:hypothetical protein